ncbi:hypothetical protein [Beijerinckia sp. L45]|uniref:hypothetical protein n=1 Tax=Beijerinckia sp. L45 TaxID=1641855 RepID=UPI00131CC44E|nr:hypothetical protein [Beijerinckia sp. L45]
MKLSDFSSVVQLGVGLHAGAALLQLASDLATAPLSRKLRQIETLAESRLHTHKESQVHLDRAKDLITDLQIAGIGFDKQYRQLIKVNGIVSLALITLLVWLSVDADREVCWLGASAICALSIVPALFSFALYGWQWSRYTGALKLDVEKLQSEAVGH